MSWDWSLDAEVVTSTAILVLVMLLCVAIRDVMRLGLGVVEIGCIL